MPREYPRSRRIAEQIQRELSGIIRLELKDPRVGMITITDVEVTQDQSHARVFFTALGGQDRVEDAVHGLQHAAGFLRTQLAHRMKLRTVPQLQFKYDQSVERGMHLSQLIDAAVAEDAARAARASGKSRPRGKK
jgi:ribosome-binding factor A